MADYKVTLPLRQGLYAYYSSTLHNNLLEALEHGKVQLEYQCRQGYCGSCRVRLVKGKVGYMNKPLAFVNSGEILPCSCRPLTDIEIEI
ncbi:class I ribonucleotide reductase maintenance protein YfaE [Xenorhabdus szentirmaii]|uniref:2Fe-2S ferredoxin-type domain-containing protein n=2 Tax=Xenorhabdus szentirmaii TaxID=290112 RepID=W1IW09_9GAMM|nr:MULTISPECIES: class I ribonucleotide reductase maintenance protein YfaE [Xenorhabdus]MBD2793065.1 2Fe-2S ferredoxin-like protein [Xenorhabdus sp. CUL]MBD2799256.1 2Fe-2S ferredoxin-like protein [Xenorhabdus sp. M]MBD2804255.1 2Fe-2S ferredoxin-like protein [Xenorhabdus sp. ZM]MBD2820768.1 2Fe-2S ferredoxin-like protein [Xenorhabdus sp. 42]MBD2824524.1 2Fe-2S ferredoxin-like protein [Xenorhabdus sp. 5]